MAAASTGCGELAAEAVADIGLEEISQYWRGQPKARKVSPRLGPVPWRPAHGPVRYVERRRWQLRSRRLVPADPDCEPGRHWRWPAGSERPVRWPRG